MELFNLTHSQKKMVMVWVVFNTHISYKRVIFKKVKYIPIKRGGKKYPLIRGKKYPLARGKKYPFILAINTPFVNCIIEHF